MKNSKYKQKGFTLIELVVVIVIIGILSAVAAPKYLDLRSDAHKAVISGAVGAIKSAVYLFKSKTIASGKAFSSDIEFSGVKGGYYQPWAATSNELAGDYSLPPEIFEAAGLDTGDWSHHIFSVDETQSFAVIATPRSKYDKTEPTESELKETNCYFIYHWKFTGEPAITIVDSGC